MLRTLVVLLALLFLVPLDFAATQEPEAPAQARVEVRVVDEDGEPFFKASVSLEPTEAEMARAREEGQLAILVQSARTDPDGEAVLMVAAGESRTMTVSAARRGDAELLKHELPALEADTVERLEVTLRTRDDADVTLRVIDASSGEPLEGVALVPGEPFLGSNFTRTPLPVPPTQASSPRTDARGLVTVSAASWRNRIDTLHLEGYGVRRIAMGGSEDAPGMADGAAPVEVRLEREAPVHVTLVGAEGDHSVRWVVQAARLMGEAPRARGLSGGELYLEGQRMGDEDRYLVRGVPPGVAGQLSILVRGQELQRFTDLKAGVAGKESRVTLDMEREGAIRGRLLRADDTPVPGARVAVARPRWAGASSMRDADRPLATTLTDDEGRFVFTGLMAGSLVVGLPPRSPAPEVNGSPGVVKSQAVELETGRSKERVTLRLVEGLYVSGRVLDEEGTPCAATVFGTVTDWDPGDGARALTASTGEGAGAFRVGPFPPGKVRLSAHGEGDPLLVRADAQVEAGAADVRIVLERGFALRGHAAGEASGPRTVWASWGDRGNLGMDIREDRSFELRGLPAGVPISLYQLDPGGPMGDAVVVTGTKGQTLEGVELPPLREPALVRVRVEGVEGAFRVDVTLDPGFRAFAAPDPEDPGVRVARTPSGTVTVELRVDPGGAVAARASAQAVRGETTEVTITPAAQEEKLQDGD